MTRRLIVAALLAGVTGCAKPTAPAPKAAPAPVSKAPAVARPPAKPVPPTLIPVAVIRVLPVSAMIEPGDDGVQVVASEEAGGATRDVTAGLAWRAEPAGVVRVEPTGYVRPVGAGEAVVKGFRDGKVVASTKMKVAAVDGRSWDFGTDIVPIFTRYGCNTGGCHGKADGQNGFHLSLFGYDPAGDHQMLTRESAGRRLSRFDAENSLLIRKAAGRTPHGGGQKILHGSDSFRTLAAWIKAGAPESSGKTHGAIASLRVEPTDARLDGPGPRQVRVVAKYADGHERDVTRLSGFRLNDDTVAAIDPNGRATLTRRAEVDLVVRYQTHVVASRIGTIINPDLKFDFAKLPRANFIDDELLKRLASLKVPPSPTASDATFLRRITLDLTGQQPRPDQVKEFLADKDPAKRAKKVDELLKDRDFTRFWQVKFGDMLQISAQRFPNGSGQYQAWLQDRLFKNAPWDGMVRELLTSVGDPNKQGGGPVNYALDGLDPKVAAEQTAQRFLGLRLRCAQCHDHPFDVWTQDDYYGLAAFFAKVDRGGMAQPGGMMGRPVVGINPKGSIDHLRTKKPATPTLLGGVAVQVDEKADPRKALADWMTRPDNPFFARAMANWTWAQFFGKGLADPPDDLSRSNPPVHPELLDRLAREFVASKYDLRSLIRAIATSNAYAMSSEPTKENASDHRLFSHQIARPLTAHQMADAIAQVTDVKNRYGQLGVRKAIEVNDPGVPSAILDTLGRCPRVAGCSSVATPSLSLRQSLLLIGGDVVDGKVASLNGYLSNLLELKPEPGDVVDNLYLRTLCRPPTAEETSHWTAELKSASSFNEACEDLFWALLSSREFAFNH